jgi:hypothetical protein
MIQNWMARRLVYVRSTDVRILRSPGGRTDERKTGGRKDGHCLVPEPTHARASITRS